VPVSPNTTPSEFGSKPLLGRTREKFNKRQSGLSHEPGFAFGYRFKNAVNPVGLLLPQSVDKRCRRSHGRVERLAMDGPLVSRYLTLLLRPLLTSMAHR